MIALVVRKKCVGCSYVKSREKLMIVLRKYCIRINKLFVFQYFSDVFKKGFCEIERGSLGLAEKSRVSEKKEVASKKACKL
jgi:hypothetical protein